MTTGWTFTSESQRNSSLERQHDNKPSQPLKWLAHRLLVGYEKQMLVARGFSHPTLPQRSNRSTHQSPETQTKSY